MRCVFLLCWCSLVSAVSIFPVPSQQYPTIHDALQVAQSNDIIEIKPGVHNFCGASSPAFIANLTIRAESSAAAAVMPIIDCQGRNGALTLDVATLTVQGLGFTGGYAPKGAVICLANTTTIGNYAVTITMKACAFWNNTAFSSNYLLGGGVLFVAAYDSVSVRVDATDSIFRYNSASDEAMGGAILILLLHNVPNQIVSVIGGIYQYNRGGAGGAIEIFFFSGSNSSSCLVDGGIFSHNMAYFTGTGGGGVAITINDDAINSNFTVQNGYYDSNWGPQGGGVNIYFITNALHSYVSVVNCHFSKNTCSFAGAAVNMMTSALLFQSTILLKDSTFADEIAANAGGNLFLEFVGNVDLSFIMIDNSVFTNSQASVGGGCGMIFADNTFTRSSLHISNSQFSSCYSQLTGGGGLSIFFDTGIVNSSVVLSNSSFWNNTAGYGGGVSIQPFGESVNISIRVDNCRFYNNTALLQDGGALVMMTTSLDGINFEFSGNDVANNRASGMGGALSITAPVGMQLRTSCLDCVTDRAIGIIPPPGCGYPKDFNLCTNTFSAEYTVRNVFVPYKQNCTISIVESSFRNNTAKCRGCAGGAVFIANGLVQLSNLTFVNNAATQRGGGVFVSGTAEIVVSGSVSFQNNTAATQTAIAIASQASVIFGNNTFVYVGSGLPAGYTAQSGVVQMVELSNTGEIIVNRNANLYVECPRGFQDETSAFGTLPVLVPGWPNLMLTKSFGIGCFPCDAGTYSLKSASVQVLDNGTYPLSIQCHECAFGGNCSFGGSIVLAVQEFWGIKVGNEWKFTQCPMGYCCQSPNGCILEDFFQYENVMMTAAAVSENEIGFDACAKGRDNYVPLCGACLEGFSQNMRGEECSVTEDCRDGKWAWPVMIIVALLFALVVIGTSGPKARFWAALDVSWVIPVLVFFFQNASLIYSLRASEQLGKISTAAVVVKGIVEAVSNLHLSSSSASSLTKICVIPNLSTEGAIALQLALPFGVGVFIATCYICVRGASMIAAVLHKPELTKQCEDLNRRFGPALLKLALLFYTSIASVAGTLLHCVPVNGIEQRVVFRAGAVMCYTWWQKILWVVFCFVFLFPICLLILQIWARRKSRGLGLDSSEMKQTLNEASSYRSKSQRVSLWLRVIEEPYRSNRWYWPSVVLTKRLLIVLLHSFETDPAIQAMWFVVFFVAYLLLNAMAAPHKNWGGDLVDNVALAVLSLTSLGIVRTGTLIEAAVLLHSGTAFQVSVILHDVLIAIFFIPPVLCVMVVAMEIVKWRKGWDLRKSCARAMKRGEYWVLGRSDADNDNNNNNSSLGLEMSSLEWGARQDKLVLELQEQLVLEKRKVEHLETELKKRSTFVEED